MSVRPTVRLAVASLRKAKASMLVLAGFAALAAMMINLGLVLATAYPSSFDTQAAKARVPDIVDLTSDRFDSTARDAQLDAHPGVAEVDREPVVWPDGRYAYRDGTNETAFSPVFADFGSVRSQDVPQLREGAEPLGDGGIYLPYFFHLTAGYSVGDTFSFYREGTTVDFTVRGFTDDLVFGSGTYRFYVDDVTFAGLADQLSGYTGVYTKIRLGDPRQTTAVLTLLTDAFYDQQVTDPAIFTDSWTYADLKAASTFMGGILAAILLVAAAIVGLVALVVVRFRVAASIEESMTNIGILKTMGYTSGQVAWSLVGQFGLVVGVGAVVGVVGSHALLPLVASLLEQESARPWTPGLAPIPSLVTVVAVTAATLLVAGVASIRIRRLTPLTALRSGLTVHSFKRNHLPLATTRGRLPWLLAAKSAFAAKGQLVAVTVAVVAVTFMSVVGVALYENVGVRSEHFAAVAFGEVPDVQVFDEDPDAAATALADLSERDDVRSAFFFSTLPARVDGTHVTAAVTDDFARTEGTLLYRGRYPVYDNEVAIAWSTADALGKKVGDTVRIDDGGQDAEFLVTGLMNFGATALTTDGVLRIDTQYQHHSVYVYLDDPKRAQDLVDQIGSWGVPGLLATDVRTLTASQAAVYGNIMALVSLVVLGITVAVVVLVLFLVLSMAILRGRRGLGIQRAVGFTTRQLVGQVVMTYLPVVAVGAAVGAAVGYLTFPWMIDAVFQTLEAHVTSMHASVAATAALVVGVVALAGVVATLVATKVRRVSVYTLVTE